MWRGADANCASICDTISRCFLFISFPFLSVILSNCLYYFEIVFDICNRKNVECFYLRSILYEQYEQYDQGLWDKLRLASANFGAE